MITRLTSMLLIALASWVTALAEGYPRGPERAMGGDPIGPQQGAAVAARPTGEFMVVWSGYGFGAITGIFGRQFDPGGTPLGPAFQVSTSTTYSHKTPAIAAVEGGYLVVWASDADGSLEGILGRAFDVRGLPLGPPFPINVYTTGAQSEPAVASDGQGTFVVVWQSAGQDGSGDGIFGRLMDRRGFALTPELAVNEYTTNSQNRPSAAMDASGSFVVVWDGHLQDSSGRGVAGRLFSASGAPLGGDFQVNSYTTGDQTAPSVAMGGAGQFAAGWASDGQDGSLGGVFGQLFDGGGAPVGPEFQANAYTTQAQAAPSVAMDAAGSFAIAWESAGPDGSGLAAAGRRFDDAGAPLGSEFVVNTYTTLDQAGPAIASDAKGNFVVVWQSYGQDGSYDGIFGQVLAGAPLLTVPAAGGTVDCSDPASIRPTLSWEPLQYDKYRVFMAWDPAFVKGARISSGDRFLKASSWTPPVKKWRRACRRALEANPSSPVLYFQVLGVDVDARKREPGRKNFGNVRQVDVLP